MSGAANDKTVEKTKARRSKRGGVKNKGKQPEQSLESELIKLLNLKELKITPRAKNESSNQSKAKAQLSESKKINDIVPKIVKAILETCYHPEVNTGSFKSKKKAKASGEGSSNNLVASCGKSHAQRLMQLKKAKAEIAKKKKKEKDKNKKYIDFGSQNDFEKKSANESRTTQKTVDKSIREATFPKYIGKKLMLEILAEQNAVDPLYVKGDIRINLRNINQAFLNVEDETDIMITGIRDRNRALEKDVVAVMINPAEEWRVNEDNQVQKTGTVVCILEKVHSRNVMGTLEMFKGKLRLRSRDLRVPMIYIDPNSLPKDVQLEPEAYSNTLVLASIGTWPTPHNCLGKIERIMGDVGDLEAETTALLLDNGLDVTPYSSELIEGLPSSDYVLTASDLEGREDWRQECVFTIDPATAVDLDDAVSCKLLPNGNYEVGVHISDVTHYLQALSPLDKQVSERATTVYLVNTVYHMLPKSLCQLCSLLPSQDKLSFSVIWEMTAEAQVVKHRFAKSVVNSCYQMAYEKAQAMIEEPTRQWTAADLPGLKGKYTGVQLCEIVNRLYNLSVQMRDKRFADGALSINQPKLQIILDRETGFPTSYRMEERQDSNKLIEEFMLLANMTVAKHLYETLPDTAFLRTHGKPLTTVLGRTSEELGRLGIHLRIDSAGGLQSSLSIYEKTGLEGPDQEFVTACRMMVINALCAQSMPRANYICSASIKKVEALRHFALNVPFYTHFTSPIRRYADCVVHRLLFASMTNLPLPTGWSSELCAKIASNCNGKKYSAKIAQEKSNELYFINLLSRMGPTETMAIVMRVKEYCLDVILCHVGINARLFFSDIQKKAEIKYDKEDSVPTVIVKWKNTDSVQVINVFSLINLRIEKHPKSYAIHGVLLPPRLNDATYNA